MLLNLNRAGLRLEEGDLPSAEVAYREVLKSCQEFLEHSKAASDANRTLTHERHPQTLAAISGLAQAIYLQAGLLEGEPGIRKAEEAQTLMLEAENACIETLGMRHPQTLAARSSRVLVVLLLASKQVPGKGQGVPGEGQTRYELMREMPGMAEAVKTARAVVGDSDLEVAKAANYTVEESGPGYGSVDEKKVLVKERATLYNGVLAVLLQEIGELDEAAERFESVIRARKELKDELLRSSPTGSMEASRIDTLIVISVSNLGSLRYQQALLCAHGSTDRGMRMKQAEEQLQEASGLAQELAGAIGGSLKATCKHNLDQIYIAWGKPPPEQYR